MIFVDEGLWTTVGCKNLKHLSERIKKHEESALHLENACKFKIFGTVNIAAQIDSAHKISIQKHNEFVAKYRHILNRVIECLQYCDIHEPALRSHTETQESANHDNILDLLSLFGNLDSVLDDHLNSRLLKFLNVPHTLYRMSCCMYQVYIEELINDINAANYTSLHSAD